MIDQTWKDHIKAAIRNSLEITPVLRSDIRMAVHIWDYNGFANEQEAKHAFQEYVIGCQIRTYCRRNRITTRKGSKHSFDCRQEHTDLWWMVRNGAMEGQVDNLQWWWRNVDGLKNLYIMFK